MKGSVKELGLFIMEQIKSLVGKYERARVDVKANLTSYSVVFSAVIGGKEKKHFEMIDEGLFTEDDFDRVSEAIANHYRSLPDFDKNKVNKYTVFFI